MRSGATFGEASATVMQDVDMFNDYMSREPARDSNIAKTPPPKKRQIQEETPRQVSRPRTQYYQGNTKGVKGNSKGQYRPCGQQHTWQSSRWKSNWKEDAQDGHAGR